MKQMRNRAVKPWNGRINVIYEDKQILLVDKPAGLIVHPNDSEQKKTLLNQVRNYLRKTGAWDASDPAVFRPMPCNRLDRFTSGIVIFAKTWESMKIMNRKLQQREVEKKYSCVVVGQPNPRSGKIENYLEKNDSETYVTVHKRKVSNGQYACMEYRTIGARNGLSLLECRLITGRTHQIRAQLASIGCPILGDMKYGDRRFNQKKKKHHQLLCAHHISFSFATDAGVLNYLKNKSFQIRRSVKLPV